MRRSLADRIFFANAMLLSEGRLDAIGDFFAPEYVIHLTDQDVAGHEAVRRFLAAIRSAFADFHFQVEILVKSKDRVAWMRTLRATHRGAYMGFPATGRPLVWRDMVTSRFRDGLIAEDWVITDLAERLLLARKG